VRTTPVLLPPRLDERAEGNANEHEDEAGERIREAEIESMRAARAPAASRERMPGPVLWTRLPELRERERVQGSV